MRRAAGVQLGAMATWLNSGSFKTLQSTPGSGFCGFRTTQRGMVPSFLLLSLTNRPNRSASARAMCKQRPTSARRAGRGSGLPGIPDNGLAAGRAGRAGRAGQGRARSDSARAEPARAPESVGRCPSCSPRPQRFGETGPVSLQPPVARRRATTRIDGNGERRTGRPCICQVGQQQQARQRERKRARHETCATVPQSQRTADQKRDNSEQRG